jgi:hypothetical protein
MNSISIEKFFECKNNNFSYCLDSDIINAIHELSDLVSAPEYNKTPDFILDKYKKKKKELNNYVNNIEFNPTIIKKNEGVDKEIDSVRILLNKLTDKSFDNISVLIDEKISCLEKKFNKEECIKMGEIIYKIMISNILFSKIYSKLYSLYLFKYKFLDEILNLKINNFIDYYNTEKNKELNNKLTFDELSIINNLIDKKNGEAHLFINLYLNQQIETQKICDIINNLLELFFEITNLPNKIYLVDQVSDILYIFIKDFYLDLKEDERLENIINSVNYICNMKPSSRESISNKSIFKFMDLKDEIKI